MKKARNMRALKLVLGKINYTKTSSLAYENECHQESLRVIVFKIIYYASRIN